MSPPPRHDAPWSRRAFRLGVGALSGLLAGLLGIGGGLVVGPFLVLCGMELPRALGTALVVVAPVATVGVLTELLVAPENLLVGAALAVMAGGQLGAPLGASLVVHLPERVLRPLFVAVMVFVGLRNLGVFGAGVPKDVLPGLLGVGAETPLVLVVAGAVGVVAGISSSLFGIGGGLIVVPGLVYLVGGIAFDEAAATSLLAMVPTALRGVWIARRQERIEVQAAWTLAPAALVAAVMAVLLRNWWLTPGALAQLFGAFLLFAAVQVARGRSASSSLPQKASSASTRKPPVR